MSFVPRFVTHNASLKLLAFLGAVFLWAIVPGAPQGGETLSDVPVRVQVADLAWVPSGPTDPSAVQIRLSGPTREIIRLAREGATLRVPIDRVSSPDTIVTLRRDWVSLSGAPGVVVDEIVPGSVRIFFEEASSEAIPLVVRTTGRLPAGLALAAPVGVTPVVAGVRGPARLIEGLDSLALRPLDLGTVRASGIFELEVDTAGLGQVLVTPLRASVGLRIEPAAERILTDVPIEVADAPGFSVLIEPATADLRLSGAPSRLGAAPFGAVRLAVDGRLLRGMEPGESRTVPLGALAVPELLQATPVTDSVEVVRPIGGRDGRER